MQINKENDMAKKGGAKEKVLRHLITEFAIEAGVNAKKETWNPAWHKLWCRIANLNLFTT